MSKFCPNCGAEIKTDTKYCPSCGSVIGETNTTNATNTNVNNSNQNQTNGMAVAGFVISLVSLFLCCGAFWWLSLIFSIIGLANAKKYNDNGKGLAIAGIVISCIILVILVLLIFTGAITSAIEELPSSIY